MQKTFVSTFALITMRWLSRLWGPTWIPVLPNLTTILIVFAVSFTIGWGVYFLSLARRQNSPNYTLAIHMPNLMTRWAILAAWTGTLCSRCKWCYTNVTPTVATPLWPSVGVKPNTWKSWRLRVFRDSRMFRARQQGAKHLALGCSWCHWKILET